MIMDACGLIGVHMKVTIEVEIKGNSIKGAAVKRLTESLLKEIGEEPFAETTVTTPSKYSVNSQEDGKPITARFPGYWV